MKRETKSWTRTVSALVFVVGIAGAALWDIVPALTPEKSDTISEVQRAWTRARFGVLFGVMATVGHWYGPGINSPFWCTVILWIAMAALLIFPSYTLPIEGWQWPASAALAFTLGATMWGLK